MFHDATVSGFVVLDDELRIETEGFSGGPDEKIPPARILITGIADIYRNGDKIDAFSVESDDAEIFGLDVSATGVELILIWHFWNRRPLSDFAVYLFPMANLHTEAIGGGPLKFVPDTQEG